MKKHKTLLVLTITTLVVLLACKKEKPELNPAADPCACASEVTADFVIEELLTQIPNDIWIETDTTLHDKRVRFRALEDNAEYTWYIGLDIETNQAPWKFFSDQWIGNNIPITLVVKKDPNKTCFPDDDGYDSITKTFYVSQFLIDHGWNEDVELGTIEGVYRVFSNELNDSIDIEVDVVNINSTISVNITNFDGTGINCGSDVTRGLKAASYREIVIDPWYSFVDASNNYCNGLSGTIRNPLNGPAELIMNSLRWEGNPTNIIEKTYHYKGRKLSNL